VPLAVAVDVLVASADAAAVAVADLPPRKTRCVWTHPARTVAVTVSVADSVTVTDVVPAACCAAT
jgi:hypothetical protein